MAVKEFLDPSARPKLLDNVVVQDMPAHFHFDTHMHRTAELIVCRSGSLVITIHGITRQISAGEYIVIFPDIPHATDVLSDAPCSILQTHFHSRFFIELGEHGAPAGEMAFPFELTLGKRKFFSGSSTPQLISCLEGLGGEIQGNRREAQRMIQLYLAQLNIHLSRDLSDRPDNIVVYQNRHIVGATVFINANYMQKLSVSEVSGAVGISPRYLTKLFKEHLNMGVSTYITYVRISKAIDFKYANPKYPLTDLALDMGFGSLQHFSKVFKEKMCISPSRYFAIQTSEF